MNVLEERVKFVNTEAHTYKYDCIYFSSMHTCYYVINSPCINIKYSLKNRSLCYLKTIIRCIDVSSAKQKFSFRCWGVFDVVYYTYNQCLSANFVSPKFLNFLSVI